MTFDITIRRCLKGFESTCGCFRVLFRATKIGPPCISSKAERPISFPRSRWVCTGDCYGLLTLWHLFCSLFRWWELSTASDQTSRRSCSQLLSRVRWKPWPERSSLNQLRWGVFISWVHENIKKYHSLTCLTQVLMFRDHRDLQSCDSPLWAALGACRIFSRSWQGSHVFPRLAGVAYWVALPDFKPWRTRYESVNYGISNYWST